MDHVSTSQASIPCGGLVQRILFGKQRRSRVRAFANAPRLRPAILAHRWRRPVARKCPISHRYQCRTNVCRHDELNEPKGAGYHARVIRATISSGEIIRMSGTTEWQTVHDTACTNTNPNSCVDVTINTTPICPNMTNKEFRQRMMKVMDAAVVLVSDRIVAVSRWDAQERARATTYFGRADDDIRAVLVAGLPKLLSALKELAPEKIVRWDDSVIKNLTCALVPDSGQNRAGVCKPDSENRVIAIYSAFCSDSDGELWHGAKVKTIIHECTHYTDTFNSDDLMYGNTESGMRAFALGNSDKAIRNADSIVGYISTFDRTVAR